MSYHVLHNCQVSNLSAQFVLKCKSGKNFADFTIFSWVSSHISTLAHRNFTKLTQKLCLIMFYIIAKFQENLSTATWLKSQIWQRWSELCSAIIWQKSGNSDLKYFWRNAPNKIFMVVCDCPQKSRKLWSRARAAQFDLRFHSKFDLLADRYSAERYRLSANQFVKFTVLYESKTMNKLHSIIMKHVQSSFIIC